MIRSDFQSKGGICGTFKKMGHYNWVMEHLVPKNYHIKRDRAHLSFLCPYNICGYIHEKDCSNLIKCYHRSYNIPLITWYVNCGVFRCYFYVVPISETNYDLPRFQLRWNWHTHLCEVVIDNSLGLVGTINRYLNTTLKYHLSRYVYDAWFCLH